MNQVTFDKKILLNLRLKATLNMLREAVAIGGFISPLGVLNQELGAFAIMKDYLRQQDENLLVWADDSQPKRWEELYSRLYCLFEEKWLVQNRDILLTMMKNQRNETLFDFVIEERLGKKTRIYRTKGLRTERKMVTKIDLDKLQATKEEEIYLRKIMDSF